MERDVGTVAARAEGPAERRELDDLTLERARRGDPQARRALVVCHERTVFAFLGRFLGASRPEEIEDLAQETFLRVFRELPRFRPDGTARLSTWILTIASRLAIDAQRRRARRGTAVPIAVADALPSSDRADHDAERRRLGERIAAAVGALPDDYRVTFLLREAHDLDYGEIATALDIDLGTVKSRLSRARAQLRNALLDEAP